MILLLHENNDILLTLSFVKIIDIYSKMLNIRNTILMGFDYSYPLSSQILHVNEFYSYMRKF